MQSLREAKGYSQQALADIANVEKSTIKRIEQAHYSPTLDVLISLARALDIELSVLMDVPNISRVDSDLR
ncbi:helix-turn-helix transcriptional regulator [Hymenobacter sp. M29]|uniref:Helix-turn-helix transcriptional regulator n=1 Tax=Hymenobacter mellowenesis TaxID=3063995 RepID=A0ABT9AI71_9BACT|nr:helix-turn-helix transcriptional regulator [Hymenobacter sp. M29]MDO7849570.1 helix-turn-helix transcriptional regulator [Hymenobacter sp. M29]